MMPWIERLARLLRGPIIGNEPEECQQHVGGDIMAPVLPEKWGEVEAAEDRVRETEAVLLAEFDRVKAENERMKPVYDSAMAYVEGWGKPLPFDPRIKLHINLIQAYRKAKEAEA